MYESGPEQSCCESSTDPIETCHRQDCTWMAKQKGANLYCCCCGRMWQGSEEEALKSLVRYEDWLYKEDV